MENYYLCNDEFYAKFLIVLCALDFEEILKLKVNEII